MWKAVNTTPAEMAVQLFKKDWDVLTKYWFIKLEMVIEEHYI